MKKLLPVLFVVNALILLGLSWGLIQRDTAADVAVGGAFELTASDGAVRTDQDFLGKALLVYFGYTYCPDVCPTSLISIADAYDLLSPEDRAKTQALFVSVDPQRDTLKVLAAYTPNFHDQILGLTGTKSQIDDMVKKYKAKYEKIDGQGMAEYLIDHSAVIYLMDEKGQFVRHFEHNVEPRLLANALHDVIKDIE